MDHSKTEVDEEAVSPTDEEETQDNDDFDFNQSQRKLSKRTSIAGPSPHYLFGPKGRIIPSSTYVTVNHCDPADQRLLWHTPPNSILVVKKIFDDSLKGPFTQLVIWLIKTKKLKVYVEEKAYKDIDFSLQECSETVLERLISYTEDRDLTDVVDLIICMGGDGTLLYISSLFQESVPPVISFHFGSLGFLSPVIFTRFEEEINKSLAGNVGLTLRSRLKCKLHNINTKEKCIKQFLVLNEVVIDRGLSPFLCNIDLYIDNDRITTVQGDGVIISTPSGSTAYAVSAGASMIHPSVPAIMITPICPHSLSFRPVVVPAGVELKIEIPSSSRTTAWVSFDGRNRQELKVGHILHITTSQYAVPCISADDPVRDWFASLAQCLHWNERKIQKEFTFFSKQSSFITGVVFE